MNIKQQEILFYIWSNANTSKIKLTPKSIAKACGSSFQFAKETINEANLWPIISKHNQFL